MQHWLNSRRRFSRFPEFFFLFFYDKVNARRKTLFNSPFCFVIISDSVSHPQFLTISLYFCAVQLAAWINFNWSVWQSSQAQTCHFFRYIDSGDLVRSVTEELAEVIEWSITWIQCPACARVTFNFKIILFKNCQASMTHIVFWKFLEPRGKRAIWYLIQSPSSSPRQIYFIFNDAQKFARSY